MLYATRSDEEVGVMIGSKTSTLPSASAYVASAAGETNVQQNKRERERESKRARDEGEYAPKSANVNCCVPAGNAYVCARLKLPL
jgi:hypothetical protein